VARTRVGSGPADGERLLQRVQVRVALPRSGEIAAKDRDPRGAGTAIGGLRDWRGRPLLVTDAAQAQQTVGATMVLDRAELHRALRAPLPAAQARAATPVHRLEPDPTGVTVISDGQPITRADAVIVADGIGSSLRGQLLPRHPGVRRTGRVDLRGVLPAPAGMDVTGLLASIMIDRRSGSMFGLFPIGEGNLYWFTDSALRGNAARRG
jgi:2-polyprenyl-6-methoxyphenol hydroxylase-like FAD-dependent oxidoreductase